ncbi:glycosyltransferase family 2 protein [Aquirufa sp. HETE-83D]|uniref:Glycosyltransferase family 2 protein n=1 Tax=Aquirufa esocilacus TaxID=3096513 RepID=A0ABW6DIW1_9BACT
MEKIVISFCISTYNRETKLLRLIYDLLKFVGDSIEVVVSDNNSLDSTFEKLSYIRDSRLRIFSNKENIGAIPNYIKSISLARGEFVIFCTDKDSINVLELPKIIEFLKINSNLSTGIIAIDALSIEPNLIFNKGRTGLANLAYLSRHPTGYFFNNTLLRQLLKENDYTNNLKYGVFPFEFIVTNLCLLGKSAKVNFPFFFGETSSDTNLVKSFSFSTAQNNIYFFPEERFSMFLKYVNHLCSLPISYFDKINLLKILIRRTLGLVTVFYKKMVEDESVCNHYGILSKKVGFYTIIKNYITFVSQFILRCSFSNIFIRIFIIIIIHFDFRLISRVFVNKLLK